MQHESGNGVVVALIRRRAQAEALEGVLRRHHAVDKEGAVLALDHVRLLAFHAGKVAGDGFEQIGLGDDAFERAIFVKIMASRTGAF